MQVIQIVSSNQIQTSIYRYPQHHATDHLLESTSYLMVTLELWRWTSVNSTHPCFVKLAHAFNYPSRKKMNDAILLDIRRTNSSITNEPTEMAHRTKERERPIRQ